MKPGPDEQARPVTGVLDLVETLRSGEKPRAQWRVGTEHEKIGLRRSDLSPIPYQGERGIGALLHAIAQDDDWEKLYEGEHVTSLRKAGASITLEPGGQLELSGAPLHTIHQTCAEFQRHLALVRRISKPFDIIWLALGANPIHQVSEAPRMPKARYDIMRRILPQRGDMALDMMHLTATVQANFDFESEVDMARKMRAAMGATPIVSAMFANSPLYRGAPSGYISRRVRAWRRTDPARCGLLPFVFEPDFGYRRYVEWALDVPMFFIQREGRYLPVDEIPFRRFMQEGFAGRHATQADWDLHVTTLFPEVRCKRFIEVRGADAVPEGLTCALPALWKGLLYDADALEATLQLGAGRPFSERVAALDAAARQGLAARAFGRPMLELARELFAIAASGLSGGARDEQKFLEPLAELLERGTSPGEALLARLADTHADTRADTKGAQDAGRPPLGALIDALHY